MIPDTVVIIWKVIRMFLYLEHMVVNISKDRNMLEPIVCAYHILRILKNNKLHCMVTIRAMMKIISTHEHEHAAGVQK